jgi:hypothetical protein
MAIVSGRTECGRLWVAVFLLLFLTYAYCRQSPSDSNAVTRTALAVTLLEERTACIDEYEAATCDKAFYAGHYYPDKAPGLTFAALPSIAVTKALLCAFGKGDFRVDAASGEPSSSFKLLTIVGAIFTSALATAAAATALGWLCRKLGCTIGGALFAALGFGLATHAWGWATAFFGHALTGSCLLLGFVLSVAILEGWFPARREFLGWTLVGALLAYSVVVEYPSAIAAAIIAAMIAVKTAAAGRRRFLRTAIAGVIGALPFAVLLLSYNYLVFGSMFDLGYKHQVGFPGMQSGYVGLTYPKLEALHAILASPQLGLLWFSPILALAPFAFFDACDRRFHAGVYMFAALLVVIYFLTFNASFHYWGAGWSTGPRYVTPALGFACLPLAFLWTQRGKLVRVVMLAVFAVSFFFAMACACISMHVSPEYGNPLWQDLIPTLLRGGAKNLGELAGAPKYVNLVPLIVLWAVAAVYLSRLVRRLNQISDV